MVSPKDLYWAELGVTWRAIEPDMNAIGLKLRARLRRQAIGAIGLLLAGVPMSLAGFALGAYTLWIGWSSGTWNFVSRGVGIIAISLLVAIAAWPLGKVMKSDTGSLAEMIDLAIARTQRFWRVTLIGRWACAVAAVFGLLGYGFRAHLSRPPVMSPIEPLAILTLLAIALFLYGQRARDDLTRYRYLRSVVRQDDA